MFITKKIHFTDMVKQSYPNFFKTDSCFSVFE